MAAETWHRYLRLPPALHKRYRSAAALSKHLAHSLCQAPLGSRHILSRDRPAAGIRHNGSTLKSLPRYRGLLAGALLSGSATDATPFPPLSACEIL